MRNLTIGCVAMGLLALAAGSAHAADFGVYIGGGNGYGYGTSSYFGRYDSYYSGPSYASRAGRWSSYSQAPFRYSSGYGHGHGHGHGRNHARWHDTSHFDYHPGEFVPHYDHYHYVPGHYDFHQEGHWHH